MAAPAQNLTARQIAEDQHWWFASRARAIHAVAGPWLAAKPRRVLDVGCGAGNMMHHLARYGPVQGVEIDPRPLRLAQERGYDARLADASAGLPFDAEQFDLVAMLDVVEHNRDDSAILREGWRVLAPGGFLLITVPAFMFLWSHNDALNAHVRRYTAGELRRKIAAAGFRMKRLTYNNFFVFPMAALLIRLAAPPVNRALTGVGIVEAALLRVVSLPWGTSLIALAQKG
ncbi:MAG: methyltransferase domain-containing protein [Chloroflexi bacterium]|nr:methyltransferase domain-containing protein [Chloroflexota bacterium]